MRGFYPGLDPYSEVSSLENGGLPGKMLTGLRSVGAALRNEHPLNSLGNVGIATAKTLSPIDLGRSHRLFGDLLFQYSPTRNTKTITDRLAATDDTPLFLFSNYMDPHSPYWSAERYQRQTLGRTVDYDDAVRLNSEVMLPFPFAAANARGEIDERDLKIVRGLYDATILSGDDHISRLVDSLKQEGLWDETLLIVTADHGEVLGERDELGHKRMGHVDSVSDHLLRVPLVVAGGEVVPETVTDYVSLTDLPSLILDYCRTGMLNTNQLTNKRVVTEMPATEQDDLYDRHPDTPTDMIDRTVAEHTVVGYERDWKVIVRSHREDLAFCDSERRPLEEVPDELISTLSDRIEALEVQSNRTADDTLHLDKKTREDLADLGYL